MKTKAVSLMLLPIILVSSLSTVVAYQYHIGSEIKEISVGLIIKPLTPIVRIAVDKPYPQVYRYGETMYIRIVLENPLSEPEEIIFLGYVWFYPPQGQLIQIVKTHHTMPSETVETFDFELNCNWMSPIYACWIVAIQNSTTTEIISWDYALWSYAPF